jgi:ABC-type multidrug transport system ATPase subunit
VNAITVRGLRKSYGPNAVLRRVDLEVHANEVFGFLGPNGAGKTTTTEILEGYYFQRWAFRPSVDPPLRQPNRAAR